MKPRFLVDADLHPGIVRGIGARNPEVEFEISKLLLPQGTRDPDVPAFAWPTQPIPTIPLPFARQKMTADDVNPCILTPQERASWKDRIGASSRLELEVRAGRCAQNLLERWNLPLLVFCGGRKWCLASRRRLPTKKLQLVG